MDKQTIHLITLIIAIIGSNAWSHTSLSGRISEVENRLSDRNGRLGNPPDRPGKPAWMGLTSGLSSWKPA